MQMLNKYLDDVLNLSVEYEEVNDSFTQVKVSNKINKISFPSRDYESIINGDEHKIVDLKTPIRNYTLIYNGKVVDYIDSHEIYRQFQAYREAHGNVLIGGLGLGFITKMILLKNDVDSVTVIEKEQNIIKMFNNIDKKLNIICGDFVEYIKNNLNYNYIYCDIITKLEAESYLDIIHIKKLLLKYNPYIQYRIGHEELIKSLYITSGI